MRASRRASRRASALLRAILPTLVCFACAAEPRPEPERESWFRGIGPRADRTVFSPLELPAPNAQRAGSGAPGPGYWQQAVDYTIEAALDPALHTISGRAHVTYTNRSPDPLEYLWLHLEQNVFRADSIGARVGHRAAIGLQQASGDGVKLTDLSASGAPLPFHVYDTLARVDLPEPIAPGGGVFEFDVAFEFAIPPKLFRRFGLEAVEQGTVVQVAQWFPAVAVYDDAHGWNTLPYMGTGEFYTNFGTFDVALTVPRDHIVVATGELSNAAEVFTSEQVERLARARASTETIVIRGVDEVGDPASRPAGDGPLTWHFHAERVRTFAWAASDAFILDAAGLDGILVQSAYPKEALPLWRESTQMMRAAIAGYGERWLPYPYPVATNVNGIESGMEYPMLVFCAEREDEEELYDVTSHEIGHTWFPMVVNTDERRHAWMDEGFDTFINHYSRADWFGDEGPGGADPATFAVEMLAPDQLPIMTRPDHLPERLLGKTQYTKTGVGLVLLREVLLGPERFDFAFRKYIERWAFKSPRPADFFRTIEDAAGCDLAWFWRGWFYETGVLDQAVDEVIQPRDGRPGILTFTNRGGLVMPLEYEVTFTDGTGLRRRLPVEVWFQTDRITETVASRKLIARVVVDPDAVLPETNRADNVLPRRSEGR